jgi:hypothetical protein
VHSGRDTSGCIMRVFSVMVSDIYTTSEGFSIRESDANFSHLNRVRNTVFFLLEIHIVD